MELFLNATGVAITGEGKSSMKFTLVGKVDTQYIEGENAINITVIYYKHMVPNTVR